MKTRQLIFSTLLLFVLACTKDDSPAIPDPDPIVQQDSEPDPDPENQDPATFELMSVADNSMDVQPNPAFSWEAATDPDGDTVDYDIYIDTQAEPQNKMAEALETTSFTVPDSLALCRARTYFWKVHANDGKGGETASEIFSFTIRTLNDAEQITSKGSMQKRSNHASVVHNGAMWVLGGFVDGAPSNDVRKSTGADWGGLGSAASELYLERFFHAAASFDNKIWIAGGVVSNFTNDVWNSADGKSWSEIGQLSEFETRAEHTLTEHDGKLWIIGGSNGSGKLGDVWTSTDGSSWEQSIAEAPFGKRNFHQTVSFKDKLWIIGGIDDAGAKNDVWSSSNGIDWDLETASTEFSPRGFHKALVFDDKIWVLGSGTENDIWYSEDGRTWFDATPENSFPVKNGFTALFYEGKIWIMGGSDTDEVWEIDYELGQSD